MSDIETGFTGFDQKKNFKHQRQRNGRWSSFAVVIAATVSLVVAISHLDLNLDLGFYLSNQTHSQAGNTSEAGKQIQYHNDYKHLANINNNDLDSKAFHALGLNMGPPNRNPSLLPDPSLLKRGKRGAIASDVEECSRLGGTILEKHEGNAADAAVTVSLCIGLVNSFSSGIGGGGFIMSSKHDAHTGLNHVVSIDAREQAPRAAHKDMFNFTVSVSDDNSSSNDSKTIFREEPSRYGGLAVGIPGELKGLYHVHKIHGSGKVSWAQLLEPVIQLAENGWKSTLLLPIMIKLKADYFVDNYQDWPFFIANYQDIRSCEYSQPLPSSPESAKAQRKKCLENLKFIKEGDVIKRPKYAKTLRLVANNGSDAIFYDPEGPIVQSLVKTIRENNGIATAQDFADYRLRIGKPLLTTFLNKYQVLVPHSSSSCGIAMLSGLNIMNEFFKQNGAHDENFAVGGDLTELHTHQFVETMKWMGSARTKLGDVVNGHDKDLEVGNVDNNITNIKNDHSSQQARINYLLSPEYASSAFNNISDHHTLDSWRDYHPDFQPVNDHGTAHFSIVDQYNNLVSMTASVNLLFGSLLHDSETGIILNDQMDDFSIPGDKSNAFDLVPSVYNYVEPFKRPLSSMVPTIVFRKDGLGYYSISNTKANGNLVSSTIDKVNVQLNNDAAVTDSSSNPFDDGQSANEQSSGGDYYGAPDLVIGAAGGSRIITTVFQAVIRKYMYKFPLLETIAYPRLHHQLLPEVLYMENYTGSALKEQMSAKGHKVMVTESRSVMNGISREMVGEEWHAVGDWWRKLSGAWSF